jgi:hypothetical protein
MAKIYCGDRSNLPAGGNYARFGTRNECLKCGFGAAMYKYRWVAADNQPKPPPRTQRGCLRSRNHAQGNVRGNQFNRRGGGYSPARHLGRFAPSWSIAMGIVTSVVAFVLLYKFPPHFITKREKNKDVIDWGKFAGVYALIIVGIAAIATLIHAMRRRV